MLSGGFCPITYEPTRVILNDRTIRYLDFRDLDGEKPNDLRIPIPAGGLRVGENTLRITTGRCQYAIDSMRVNALTLVQR